MSVVQFINRPAPFPPDPAIALLGNEREGAAFDFINGRAWIRDRITPANNFLGDVNDLLTYASPSPKWIFNRHGVLEQGTTLRCDHDPVTGEPLGLLVEGQDTNRFPHSAEISLGSTLLDATVTSNIALAPDGTMTADKIVENNTNAQHAVRVDGQIVSGQTYIVRMRCKAAERTVVNMFVSGNLGGKAGRVNLLTGAIENGTPVVKNLGNGWWDISFNVTASATGSGSCYAATYNNAGSYLGDGVSGLYVWGAELKTQRSSYIPTEGSAVSRADDTITLAASAFPLGDEYTIIADVNVIASGLSSYPLGILGSGGSVNNVAPVYTQDNSLGYRIRSSGSDQARANAAGVMSGRVCFRVKKDDFALAVNGTLVDADTSGDLPLNPMGMYLRGQQSQPVFYHVKNMSIIPRGLSNAELITRSALS